MGEKGVLERGIVIHICYEWGDGINRYMWFELQGVREGNREDRMEER